MYGVVIPALVDSYEAYLARADALDDAPTVYRLRHILLDKQLQIEQMRALVARVLPEKRDSDQQWQEYLRAF